MKEANTGLTQVLQGKNLRNKKEEAKREINPLTANLHTNSEPLKVSRTHTNQASLVV